MGNYKIVAGQNLYDVSLHLYGSIEGITDLLICNPSLSMDDTLHNGMELIYSDDFEIDGNVVAWYRNHTLTPSSGERAVYPKVFTLPPLAEIQIDKLHTSVMMTLRGSGAMEIDWGDNSAAELLSLDGKEVTITHVFDNAVANMRRVWLFGNPELRSLNLTRLYPATILLFGPFHVESFALTGAELDITFAALLEHTRTLDLRGTAIGDLLPLVALKSLASLDLRTQSLHQDVVDDYLKTLIAKYDGRRSCHISLLTKPSGEYREPQRDENSRYILRSGMEAVWVLTHEPSWNEAGAWTIVVGDTTYTYLNEQND